jgi:hypothetical protein
MKSWQQVLDTIISKIKPVQLQYWATLPANDRVSLLVNSDTFNVIPYLCETDNSGDTLLHATLNERVRLQRSITYTKDTVSDESKQKEEIILVIILKLLKSGANIFMPNNENRTPYDIVTTNRNGKVIEDAFLNYHIDRQKHDAKKDLLFINKLVKIKGAELGVLLRSYFNWFDSEAIAFEFLYCPVLQMTPFSAAIAPIDLLIRSAARHPEKYSLIQTIELKHKAFKNTSDAMPVPSIIDDNLALRIIHEFDLSGLAHHRWLSWGLTQSQNTSIYRVQQKKIAKVLQLLEGIEDNDIDWKRKSQIDTFKNSISELLNENTDDGKIMKYDFGVYTKIMLSISETCQECLQQANYAFASATPFQSDNPNQPFTPLQITALKAMANYAGWGAGYFDKYLPEYQAYFKFE